MWRAFFGSMGGTIAEGLIEYKMCLHGCHLQIGVMRSLFFGIAVSKLGTEDADHVFCFWSLIFV
jgi:hypothetical protein